MIRITACLLTLATAGALADRASDEFNTVRLDPQFLATLTIVDDSHEAGMRRESRPDWMGKIDQPMRLVWDDERIGRRAVQSFQTIPDLLVRDDEVMVTIRYAPEARHVTKALIEELGLEIRHDITSGAWLEAWMPIEVLPEVARLDSVYRIERARLAQPTGDGTTTEGLELGNVQYWHDAGLDGSGFTIAVIDFYGDNAGQVADLQASGDWPPDEQLETVMVSDGCGSVFGGCPFSHGNAVMEIVYDIAPGANYIAYDAHTLGDWIEAVHLAIDAGAHIINSSIVAPFDGIGDGSALPGSISEAMEAAWSAGVLPVNGAGNSRHEHWGGIYQAVDIGSPNYSDAHSWGGGQSLADTLNFLGSPSDLDEVFCIPNGASLGAGLQWNDWDDVNNDYHLRLYRLDDEAGDALILHAVSDNTQDGSPGQRPQEFISTVADTEFGYNGCESSNEAAYAWRIYRHDATGDHNFRFFSENLQHRVRSSTILPPADSPAVIGVAALFAEFGDTEGTLLTGSSSNGPVLAPGGGAPTGDEEPPKPDVASFAFVETTTSENLGWCCGFGGTSAASPHVAGMAALLWDRHSSFVFYTNEAIADLMRDIAATGDNDLGEPGFDFDHGWGRLSFQVENHLVVTTQPTDTAMGHSFDPTVTVEVRDTQDLAVLSGPTRTLDIDFGNDPSGGQANLEPPLIWHVEQGVAPFGGLSVDYPGEGYTLFASDADMSVETAPFNIIEEIFSDRFEFNDD